MNLLLTVLSVVLAYLLGSIPTSVWAGRIFHGLDVREHGSGNAGATNVIRVLGWKTGVPVLLIDVAKGWFAASLPVLLNAAPAGSAMLTNLQILAGVASIAGHVYPVFAGFRGGKGVSTVFGTLLAVHPLLTLSSIGVFLTVFLIAGIVSLASMTAGIAFPVMLFTLFDTPSLIFKVFSIVVALGLIFTHRKNISRLMKGEEKKLFRRNNDKGKESVASY